MKIGFICAAWFAVCFNGVSQLVLNPGDTWTYQFNTLPLTGSTNSFVTSPKGWFEFTLNGASLQNGDRLLYEMFENDSAEAPICSGNVIFGSPLTLSCNVPNAWADQQGIIRFKMLAGSVTVDRVWLQAIISGPSLSSYDVFSTSFVPGTGPRLDLAAMSNATLQITWPTNFTDHHLESATNLPATVWSTVTNNISIVGDRFSVTVEASDAQRIYRLHQP